MKSNMTNAKVGAIIVAAGESRRMNGIDKVFADLAGRSILARVLDTFNDCASVEEIVVVLSRENLQRGKQLIWNGLWEKVTDACPGGPRRQDSVKEGLRRLTDCQWIIIHDGARPLVSSDIIERGLREANAVGAAAASVPVKDTIKIATAERIVEQTPPRETLWSVQTPQIFRFDWISQAHRQINEDVTDDAMMVERLGYQVKLYMGDYHNIKLTTPEDLALAEIILRTL